MVLAGLRNMLRPKQREWEMVFAPGGQDAIDELAKSAFDVVVCDMRMPRVDGAALLKHVREHYPNTVRIILSGYTETETALRTIPVAHQFLSKPCDAATLQATVLRACNLQDLLSDPALRSAVGGIGKLPSVPRLYLRINDALEKPTTSLKDVAGLIEQDMAVSAKVLQVVNSGLFGLPKRISSMQHAVSYIGINMLRRILLSVQAFEAFDPRSLGALSMDQLQAHSHLTAKIASRLVKGKRESEDAFTAGILHDIGKLILPKEANPGATNITHAESGAYLLGLWGLPYSVVEAVAHHHNPRAAAHTQFDVVDAVYVGNVLAQESPEIETGSPPAGLDIEYLETLGVAGMVP